MTVIINQGMKALIIILLIAVSTAAAQVSAFRFRPERVQVGTVFHYLKTNVDGKQPENVSTYIAARERIESFKFHEKGTRAGLVIAEVDWQEFIVRRLESWQVNSKDERKLFATLTYDTAKQSVVVSIPAAKPEPEVAKIDRLPYHLYNFDLAGLNVMFAHLADPKRAFVVGIADPTFKADPLFAYKGELTITYEKEERRNGVECRRYSAAGNGIGGKGTVWVNKKRGHIEDMEFDVANNPDWKTFKLKLVKTEKMTAAQWEQFISGHFE